MNRKKRTGQAQEQEVQYQTAVAELKNPSCSTTVVLFVLRCLTFPSTPVAAGTSRASCCGRVDASTPLLGSSRSKENGRINTAAAAGDVVVSSTDHHSQVHYANELQLVGSRFLIALFVLDYGAAGVGRIMHLDVLDMAAVIPGMTVVMMDIIMTTLESIAELLGTTITPFVYRVMYPNDPLESRQLARFAVRVYAISNTLAFVLYPIISGVTWIGCNITMTMLFALVALRTLQYSVVNQVGDAAVQMAKPHWLRTFTGTSMQIPGFDVGCFVRTQTTEDTLSAHIALIVIVIAPVVAGVFLGVNDDPIPRLVVATLIAFAVMVLSYMFWYKEQVLTCGVQSEAVETSSFPASSPGSGVDKSAALPVSPVTSGNRDDDGNAPQSPRSRSSCCVCCASGVIPLYALQPFQISLICLNVIVKVVNEQVTNALTAVILVSLGGTYRTLYIGGAGGIGLLYLLFKISVEHRRMLNQDRMNYGSNENGGGSGSGGSSEGGGSDSVGDGGTQQRQHSFQLRLRRWIFVVCLICICLAISSVLLLSRPGMNDTDGVSVVPSSSASNTTTALLVSSEGACERVSEESPDTAQNPVYFTMTVAAIVFILPLYPAIKMFDVEYDAFLMDYERDRPQVVTAMTLWVNVLSPMCHLLMLGINYYAWLTASVDAAVGSVQVAVTMLTGVSVLMMVVTYFAVLDRCCCSARCSVHANLQRMDANTRGKGNKVQTLEMTTKEKQYATKENLSHDGKSLVELNTVDRRESSLSMARTTF